MGSNLRVIDSLADLKKAIPKARTQEERAHVHKRGHDLGLDGWIPVHWNADGSMIRVGELS
jgi:hypothetical protein